ncbi:Ribosomal RNA large subunit methyltransferase E [Buchnera aphidicola (Eriosoma grossulariae)]|uniref:RlmE family RNA methyltransferase n=1 Tax=Buchnera aphidicola TaxID=9 RepID=UPI003464B551
MIIKNRSKSSHQWLHEHFRDKYVKESKKRKLCSRAWFKLEQINNKYKIFKLGMNVLDLGSSPGSWSEYSVNKIGRQGQIIACDILPMKYINNVIFIQGDLNNNIILHKVLNLCRTKTINVIMSDMAPNTSGCSLIDLPKIIALGELALFISKNLLVKNGILLLKLFQGTGFETFLKRICSLFLKVKICKPDSSRGRSREVFILAIGLKN